jgi:hypothetical protein
MQDALRRLRLWARRGWSLLASLTPYPALALTAILGVLLFVVYWLSVFAHEATYIWQVDTLGSVIRPVGRTSCALPDAAGITAGSLNIAILVIYDAAFWDRELSEQSVENKRQYARRHGYTVIVANDMLDRSRPGAWSKLPAVKKHLPYYDYIMYMDVDAVIMNFNRKIEELIVPGFDIVMATDWNGPNTGVWIAKNTEFTKWFLEEAWKQDQFTQSGFPFEYEQRAVHYLMRTEIWKKRRLPKYPGDIADIRRRIFLMDQCAMNSYAVHPLYMKADRQVSQYIDGDFVIHFAGKKGKIKVDLMRQYLELSKQKLLRAKSKAT